MDVLLVGALVLLALASVLASPRVRGADAFFRGVAEDGSTPGVWTLTLSQVTTWIFARSLLNAAILGYQFGIVGTLAYAAYYGSFLTGARIVDAIRFSRGHKSVQSFLRSTFGSFGVGAYDIVVALRLTSEVFANLLVVGLIFGSAGSLGYNTVILGVSAVTLTYAMAGGLRASLRTDVIQMSLLMAILVALTVTTAGLDGFGFAGVLSSSSDPWSPGWALLAVAFLQVWSYPLHDPVMMDRGFLADRETTRRSFLRAFWLSLVCILAFGLLGVQAGLHRMGDEALMDTLARLTSPETLLLVNLALVVSAVSTLDSALSSASKLAVADMGLTRPTLRNGRIAIAGFMGGGLFLLFLGNQDLFAAVAVSGTASMFLAPVVFFCTWGDWRVPTWPYAVAFVSAMSGAAVYFLDSSGHLPVFEWLYGPVHDYGKLLMINVVVLAGGCAAFAIGGQKMPNRKVVCATWRHRCPNVDPARTHRVTNRRRADLKKKMGPKVLNESSTATGARLQQLYQTDRSSAACTPLDRNVPLFWRIGPVPWRASNREDNP